MVDPAECEEVSQIIEVSRWNIMIRVRVIARLAASSVIRTQHSPFGAEAHCNPMKIHRVPGEAGQAKNGRFCGERGAIVSVIKAKPILRGEGFLNELGHGLHLNMAIVEGR